MGMKLKLGAVTIMSAMLAIGCSKSGSSSGGSTTAESTALTIAGALSIGSSGSSTTLMSMSSVGKVRKASNTKFAVDAYRVACVTLEDTPKSCGDQVDSTGAYSANCDGFAGTPFGCFVFNTTSFATYPIVFNIGGEEAGKTVASPTGTISGDIVIDLETGTATATAVLPANSTGSTGVTATLADLQMMDGAYKIGPAAWSAVSSNYTAEDSALLIGTIKFWINAGSCPTGTTSTGQGGGGWSECQFVPASVEQAYNYRTCEFMSHDGSCYASVVTNGTYVAPTTTEINTMGENIYMKASADADSKLYMGVWQSQTALTTCGGNDQAPTWKISDGTTTDTLDFSGADSTALTTSLQTTLSSAITHFNLTLLNDIGQSGGADINSGNVSCKYGVDLDPMLWNVSAESITACQAVSECSSAQGGDFDKVMRYRMSKVFAATNMTTATTNEKAIFGGMADINFTDNAIAESSSDYTLKYGTWSGWDSVNNRPQLTEVASGVVRLDLGGCVQWQESGNPKIVPVGSYVEFHQPDGTVKQDKCRYSENRLVVPAADGYLTVNGATYKDVMQYLQSVADATIQKQTWNKACEITYNSTAMVQTYPVDMTVANIVTEFNARRNGGSPEDKAGMKFGILYELVGGRDVRDGIQSGEQFWGFDGSTSFSLTCGEIVAGAATGKTNTEIWNQIGALFDRPNNGTQQLAKLFACALKGIHAGVYDARGGVPTGVSGVAAFADTTPANNIPDVFDNLRVNSCMPTFQLTRICTKEGCGTPKVICNDVAAENGGCDKANPSGRHALLKVTPLGGGKYDLFQKEEQFEFSYDPQNNTGKKCTRTNLMTITNRTAVTAAVSAGENLYMQFAQNEAKLCDGETASEAPAAPIIFMNFVKQ